MGKGGANCCVVNCTNYFEKTKGRNISYIGFPERGCGNDEWRGKLIAAVSRNDKGFNPDNAKICSVHFEPKCLLFHGKGFKLVKNSLPTIDMPQKSIEKQPQVPRKSPLERPAPEIPMRVSYMRFSDLVAASKKLDSPWITLHSTPDMLAIGKLDENCDVEVKVMFHGNFVPSVTYKGASVRKQYDVEVCGLRRLCKDLDDTNWCQGSQPRAKACLVAVNVPGICKSCESVRIKQEKRDLRPLSATAPLCSASVPALIKEVRSVRSQLKGHEAELLKVQRRLATESVAIPEDIKEGLDQVLEGAEITDPFLQLFWQEQKKASTRDPRGMRWHPMMVRFAIYLHYQSPRAYEALRSTGVLHLPNKSTLRDYTNFFQPKEGFQDHVFQDIKKFVGELPPEKRYAALMHDEMSVRGDLVYDRRSDEIIGFVNPQTWNFKKESENVMATHVLVFMAVGINNHLKRSLGYFGTQTATADVLFPLLWEAVALLEQQGVKVITSTSDKASPNQKLYRMHGEGIVHQTPNPYASDEMQPFFFISDPPHLVKTIRNNLESSKYCGTRCLWNQGKDLLWRHIYKVYDDDQRRLLHISKLREEHVHLTPASRMSVRLAAQVFSESVGKILQQYYGPEASETAKFILLVDEFFDCLNTRSFDEHLFKRKPALAPYRDTQDPRFLFLERFIDYLHEWQANIEAREGYSKAEQEKMFITRQTYEGIITTVRGFTGATKYLLEKGVPYVFSNTFAQDPLEEHFGRHRGVGARSRNPSIHEFGIQETRLSLQRTLAFKFQPKGNTAGRARPQEQIQVDNEPLCKIRRH